MNPRRIDAIIDLTYGAMIFFAIVLIVAVETGIGLAFGFGVLVSYAVHVVWKMARFDPDWMTHAVEETVEQTVGETVEQTVGERVEQTVGETVEQTVGETVEEAVEQSVEEQVGAVQEQVENVEQRVDRRPREDEVEELIEEKAVESEDEGRSGG